MELLRASRSSRARAALVVGAVVGSLAVGGVLALRGDSAAGDPGRTSEVTYRWGGGPLPELVDVTRRWGVANWRHTAGEQMSGGAAIADLDADGNADLVLGGGGLGVFFGSGGGLMWPASGFPRGLPRQVSAVSVADLDRDGALDLLVGAVSGSDLVVWGGRWTSDRDLRTADTTSLPGGEPTTGLLAADLEGDARPDLLRLGYGGRKPSPDLVLVQRADREFEGVELPNSRRRSLAAEIADVDGDGSVDIWVTRDVGWRDGPDSVYSRRGGRWIDIATEIGGGQAIDGMGVTIADLTGDGNLDAYLSDIGDNELLRGSGGAFAPMRGSGAGRIRPPGAPRSVVSSSWASGTTDLNLDGRVDLVVVNGGFVGRSVVNKVPDTDIVVSDPPAVFLGIGGGRYADVWKDLGLPWRGTSRGLAIGDLDGDGDSDLVVVNHGTGVRVYRNEARTRRLVVRAAEPACATGALVRAETGRGTLVRLLTPHAFLGAHAAEVVIGGDVASLSVQFPGRAATQLALRDETIVVPCPSSRSPTPG